MLTARRRQHPTSTSGAGVAATKPPIRAVRRHEAHEDENDRGGREVGVERSRPLELVRGRLAEGQAGEDQHREREADLQYRLVSVREELKSDEACKQENEDAELKHPERRPCGVGSRE